MDELPKKTVVRERLSQIGADEQPRRIRIIHPFKKVDTTFRVQDGSLRKGVRWETIVSVLDPKRIIVAEGTAEMIYTGMIEMRYFNLSPQVLQTMVDQGFEQVASRKIDKDGNRNWLADESLAQTWTIRYERRGAFFLPKLNRDNNVPISEPERRAIDESYPFWQKIKKEVDFTRFEKEPPKPIKPVGSLPKSDDPELEALLADVRAKKPAPPVSPYEEDEELKKLLGAIKPKPPARVGESVGEFDDRVAKEKADTARIYYDMGTGSFVFPKEKEPDKPNPKLGERKLII